MKIINIISNVSLPIYTGPSFTANQRGKFLKKNFNIVLWYPFLDFIYQKKVWKRTFTRIEYINYLRRSLNIKSDIKINL